MAARIFIVSALFIFSIHFLNAQEETGIFTDGRDGQEYRWVKIGDQIWMAQNLNIGDIIVIRNNEMSSDVLVEKHCYDDKPAYCKKFGGLYTDYTLSQYSSGESSQSICPAGWHLPSEVEWMKLLNYLGGIKMVGGTLKDTSALFKGKVDKTATNSSGFTALPGGTALYDDNAFYYNGVGKYCNFWTSTNSFSLIYLKEGYRYVYLTKNKKNVHIAKSTLGTANSVRCLKD